MVISINIITIAIIVVFIGSFGLFWDCVRVYFVYLVLMEIFIMEVDFITFFISFVVVIIRVIKFLFKVRFWRVDSRLFLMFE